MARARKIEAAAPPPKPPTLSERLVMLEDAAPRARPGRDAYLIVPMEMIDEIQEALRRREVLPVPEELVSAWDKVATAIGRMVLAQPSKMTEAAHDLEEAREDYHALLKKLCR